MGRPKKQAKPEKPKRNVVIKPRERALTTARYTAAGHIVCEACFSRPSVKLRQEFDAAGKTGYTIRSHSDGFTEPDGTHHDVQITLYPCSNPECFSAIQVFNLQGVYGVDGHRLLQQYYTLSETQQMRYEAGKTSSLGIWHTKELVLSRS